MNHSTMKSCPGKDCKTKCCRYTFLFLFFLVPADKTKKKKRLLTGVKDSIPKHKHWRQCDIYSHGHILFVLKFSEVIIIENDQKYSFA